MFKSNGLVNKKKIVLTALVVMIVSLLTESFICNLRFWQSLGCSEIDTEWNAAGVIETAEGTYLVTDPENAYLEFSGINKHVDNVYVDIAGLNGNDYAYSINIYMTDAGHAVYTKLSETEIVHSVNESKYVRIHLQGDSEKIMIRLNNLTGDSEYGINAGLNVKRPFMFKWWRFLFILVLLGLLVLFRPGSVIYRIPLNLKNARQIVFSLFFIILNIVLYIGIAKVFWFRAWDNNTNNQYNYLAQSIIEGHVYLDFTPPDYLTEIDNPYDYELRRQADERSDDRYIMDFAYYNGRYYSYFGIAPVILFYIPYILLTGKMLNTAVPIVFMTMVFIVSAFWFVSSLAEKYFKNTSLGAYVFLSCVLISGAEITYCVQYAVLYSLPILMGVTFVILGLACWLRAVRSNESINKIYLIVGSFCIAMVIGCRPQLAIAVLLAFPIFGKQIKERLFFSIRGIGNTCCVIIPFLIIGCGVMYYNYIRFGKVLDFGATYNLTGFDMTHRGMDLSRFGIGFFEYLFQPFHITLKYPYVSLSSGHMAMVTDYQGQVVSEPFFGGFFAFNIFGIFMLKLCSCKKDLKNKGVWGLTVMTLIISVVIVALNVQMVGIIFRYLTDFSVFLMAVSVIIVLSLLDNDNAEQRKAYLKWAVILGVITIGVNYYTLIANGRFNDLHFANPEVYYKIKYQLFSVLMSR